MKVLRISRRAQRDLQAIWDQLAADSIPAADRLLAQVRDRLQMVAEHPHIGRSRDDIGPGLRGVVVRPYIILYRVAADHVQVARVVHGARDIRNVFTSDTQ